MNLIYPLLLALTLLIPGNVLVNAQIATLNDSDTNTTSTKTEIIPGPEPVESGKVPTPPPCDENTPPGELCRDEGDFDSCDPGFRDTGNGCKPYGERATCSNEPGSAGLKYPQDKRTACEKFDYDQCEMRDFGGGRCENIYELFWDNDCFGFANAKECDDHFNNLGQSDNDDSTKTDLFQEISRTQMTTPLTPTLEINATISDILRLLIVDSVTGTDRLLAISDLETLLENLTGNQFEIAIELEDNEDGTEKVFTITVTPLNDTMVPVEETPVEEEPETEVAAEEDDSDSNGGSSDNDNGNEPEPEPEPEPEEPEPIKPVEPIQEDIPDVPFG